jgi:hypothetical protein
MHAMSNEEPVRPPADPYADELSTEQWIEELVENKGGRYVLIARDLDRVEESALFYEPLTGMVSYVDEGDELHRQVVRRMLANGVRVFSSYDEARAAIGPAK